MTQKCILQKCLVDIHSKTLFLPDLVVFPKCLYYHVDGIFRVHIEPPVLDFSERAVCMQWESV